MARLRAKLNLRIPFKINRTSVMGVVAVLLMALVFFDYTNTTDSPTASRPSGQLSSTGSRPVRSATPAATSAQNGKSVRPQSTRQIRQEISFLAQLKENAPAVVRRYQALAAPYAESMSEIAVLHTADEKPDEAAKRALTALLPKTIQVKALLVADGAESKLGTTLLSVNVSLESSDSLAMQRAVLTLGNPAAGMKWRELALVADSDKRLITLSGLLSVLAVRYAE